MYILIIVVIIIILLNLLGIFLNYSFNSKSNYCKASIKTNTKQNSTNTQNKTLNRQHKNSMEGKKQCKRGTRAKP
jgi:flagellar basal body-associated protein FliL